MTLKRQSRTTPQPKIDASELRVLLDEGVPISVKEVFESFGYKVIRQQDVLPQGASDLLVARTARLNEAVLVATDKDMSRIAGRYGRADDRFSDLSLIKIGCPEPLAAQRLAQAMSLIEHEWKYSCEKAARKLYIEIGGHFLRTYR